MVYVYISDILPANWGMDYATYHPLKEPEKSIEFIATYLRREREFPQKVVSLVTESDPQNGRTIQVKDLFHKLPRMKGSLHNTPQQKFIQPMANLLQLVGITS